LSNPNVGADATTKFAAMHAHPAQSVRVCGSELTRPSQAKLCLRRGEKPLRWWQKSAAREFF
jgi:hypothetical protein